MNDESNPTGLSADIAEADALMREITVQMQQAEAVIEMQALSALMAHALLHKVFFQATQTIRSKS